MRFFSNFRGNKVFLALVLGACAIPAGYAQNARVAAAKARAAQIAAVLEELPPAQRRHLSSAAQNIIQFAHRDEAMEDSPDIPQLANQLATIRNSPVRPTGLSLVPVNDPRTDFVFSVMSGFTQSETSTAWCGANLAVGFNDSNSVWQTLLFGPGGLSFSSSAYSTDGGQSFFDAGPVNPGPNFTDFLLGDPVLSCGNDRAFHYSQTLASGVITKNGFVPLNGVAVSRSTNGGATWAAPVPAVLKDGNTHFTDKPWHTLDPQHPRHMFLTYTDFDVFAPSCGGAPKVSIEVVRSLDGGSTWSAPVVLEEICAGPAPRMPETSCRGRRSLSTRPEGSSSLGSPSPLKRVSCTLVDRSTAALVSARQLSPRAYSRPEMASRFRAASGRTSFPAWRWIAPRGPRTVHFT